MNLNNFRSRPLPSPSSKSTLVRRTAQSGTAIATQTSTVNNVVMIAPRSPAEHYWAARALTAEAVLSARLTHHRELQSATYMHDAKRSRDLAALSKVHEAMHSKMEKFLMVLLACLVLFVILLAYIFTQTHHHRTKRPSRWWSALPSHFTIPILSPFTSVVEHETSVVSSRTIAIVLVVLAALAYAMFRHWLHSRTAPAGTRS